VALVDDDALFLKTCAANLAAAGYRVSAFADPCQALARLLPNEALAALILGPRVAKSGGAWLLTALKEHGFAGAVLVLTTAPQSDVDPPPDRTVGCIDKTAPFSLILQQLARVIDARWHRIAGEVTLGVLFLSRALQRVTWAGRAVPVSPCEFEILAHLAERAGTNVSYREIYRIIEADLFLSDMAPDSGRILARAAVERLRGKFLAIDSQFGAIVHSAGLGYHWRVAQARTPAPA
jgi:two-component system response regulator ChvI